MESEIKVVYVVVDRAFGERLGTLAHGVPAWIVDTPLNRAAAIPLRKERAGETHLTGITLFNDASTSSPEALLASELDLIDLHHGPLSADPPYSALEVIGAQASDEVRAALASIDFEVVEQTAAGFIATRRA